MKTRPLSLALLLVTMLYVVGCASPRAQWAVARSSLSTTENAIVAASQSGLIQDRDLVTLEPFAKSAQGGVGGSRQGTHREQRPAHFPVPFLPQHCGDDGGEAEGLSGCKKVAD
jgi:hypothetical protein